MVNFNNPLYDVIFSIGILSFILSVVIYIISKIASIDRSFIFRTITQLLIVNTLHSISFIINWNEPDNSRNLTDPKNLCFIQGILLTWTSISQEIWIAFIIIICYQGIVGLKIYTMKENLKLFIFFCFIAYILPWCFIVPVIIFTGFDNNNYYCFINQNKSNYKITIISFYLIRWLVIIFNIVISVNLIINLRKLDKRSKDHKKVKNYGIKTLIFSLVQLISNLPYLIFRLLIFLCIKEKNDLIFKITGMLFSASTGIVYPLIFAWHNDLFSKINCGSCKRIKKRHSSSLSVERLTPFETNRFNDTEIKINLEENPTESILNVTIN